MSGVANFVDNIEIISSNPPYEFPFEEQIIPEPIGQNAIKIENHDFGCNVDVYYDPDLKKIFTRSSVK